MICSVPGCGKPLLARGWCRNHYDRWRKHGSPEGGGPGRGEPLAFLRQAIRYEGDDCLIWPFFADKRTGHGRVKLLGKNPMNAHRVVCEAVHGPPPRRILEAAHNCGNPRCVTPAHLRWATHAGNMADMFIHGTVCRGEQRPQAKLTEADIHEIRRQSYRRIKDLAEELGVTPSAVGHIRHRRRWGWLEDRSDVG